ncbi:uncharacterized protein N7500_009425 [Penicillium coprophilum]|uniref:uncharacterized protein n=1 Tax=Penicillium coprophilum TaxID=36646 RepID=UPI0023838002|nr:uncharacterized protein N7500_009425 [Penicillium coprophilum]KAJ5153986.1 hypothetical protein N7500_009425 [Penicillium coprophilum]
MSEVLGILDRLQTSISVASVAFSPDGRLLASGSNDQTTLEGHSNLVTSVAFSPDSRLLASGSDDQITLEGHSGLVTSVAFLPNGRLLASGSSCFGGLLARRLPTGVRLYAALGPSDRRAYLDPRRPFRSGSIGGLLARQPPTSCGSRTRRWARSLRPSKAIPVRLDRWPSRPTATYYAALGPSDRRAHLDPRRLFWSGLIGGLLARRPPASVRLYAALGPGDGRAHLDPRRSFRLGYFGGLLARQPPTSCSSRTRRRARSPRPSKAIPVRFDRWPSRPTATYWRPALVIGQCGSRTRRRTFEVKGVVTTLKFSYSGLYLYTNFGALYIQSRYSIPISNPRYITLDISIKHR